MPELPEVETVRRGLKPLMIGQTFTSVHLTRDSLRFALPKDFSVRLTGHGVKDIERRGKYLLVKIDNDDTLIVHLGMSGSFHFAPTAHFIKEKHDHIMFVLGNGTTLAFNDPRRFGMMDITDIPAEHPWLMKLGIEPEQLKTDVLYPKLQHSRRPIKVALLDQTLIAGIGNLYASEILFAAKIRPTRSSDSLTHQETTALVSACQKVLQAAIKAGGSTLRDHRAPTGELGVFQHQFIVYGRGGKPCGQCKGGCTTQVVTQAGRQSYFCPTHQV
ncbi:MAG: bifunctional DNA-formamidopyrimidine glycosylase/DNA-(apurinic or apyrimidinic site) lyase [Holosporales bacterium]